ncbi:transporter substrate-binding domain-containing protein [Hydrogenimonas thermophila]|uniref:Amino acid ABC transporter substrate-binding protein, PAAT family n=1 Tax=Hydrogenimonas thermophila TaxID=223786 RepID=A0A1I5UD37_9BACT|nr:transporter substrate-binding domain-containing protein [Hydrogenimonas thermophila]SFP93162.1 amino acid ABC transporter substrate-binding protein, PAAT family [Hydrogenimonas thermophila]
MQIVKIFILLVLFINFLIAKNLNFLSPKETTWINNFKNDIKIGVTQIPNQVIKSKNGKLKGFSIDLFNIIEKKLDIKFKYVYFNSWKALIDAAKNNKIDIVFLAQKTTSRLKFLYFTDTILSLKNKLIVNIENKYNSLKELKGHKIAITSGSALEEYLKFHYPEILFVSTKSELESIKFVKQKIVDATVIELVRASYYIKKLNLNDLIIASDITYDYYLSIACNKTLPELNIILSKTLKQIKKNKLEALKLKCSPFQP